MMKKVLFVGYGAGHIRTLLPVFRHIRDDPSVRLTPILLALTTARAEAEAAGVACIGFKDLGPLDPLAEKWGRRLAGPEQPDSIVSHEESIAYMGRSYADLIATHGDAEAEALYAQKGRAAFFPVITALRALEDLEIDAVVATNSPRAERAFLEAARQLGRPSVAIWSSLASHEIAWIGQPKFSTRVCVDSPYAVAKMREAGRSSEEIVLSGNPQFDALRRQRSGTKSEDLRARHGWGPNDKVLLFAQQNEPLVHPFTGEKGDPSLPQSLNEALIAALGRTKGAIHLCVRYHPNQAPLQLPDDARISQSPQTEDLGELLHAVDAVFTCSSTVAYQGAIIGKPIVQGLFSMFSKDVPFGAIAGATTIKSFGEFDHVWQALRDGRLPAPTLAMTGPESAAGNIVGVLEELLA